MARFAFKGIDEYALRLSSLGAKTSSVAGKAIYAAADIVADGIKKNIDSLPEVDDRYNILAYRRGKKSRLSAAQKKGLMESFGIAKMQKDSDGFYNVKLGFDGYNSVQTKKYPKGQPNQLIARTLESGSSYMDAVPFVRPGVNATRKAAQAKMQQVIDEEFGKIMK